MNALNLRGFRGVTGRAGGGARVWSPRVSSFPLKPSFDIIQLRQGGVRG